MANGFHWYCHGSSSSQGLKVLISLFPLFPCASNILTFGLMSSKKSNFVSYDISSVIELSWSNNKMRQKICSFSYKCSFLNYIEKLEL